MPARLPDPERFCEGCGVRMERQRFSSGLLETIGQFRKRRTCSDACRSTTPRQHRHLTDPHAVGQRIVIAVTCPACGELLPASSFVTNARGYHEWRSCMRCRTASARSSRTSDHRASEAHADRARIRRKQDSSLETAVNNGKDWTGPELEMLSRDDLSVVEMSTMLGRTYAAVITQRYLLGVDPRKVRLAGR